jgi:hypothetical protein
MSIETTSHVAASLSMSAARFFASSVRSISFAGAGVYHGPPTYF